MMRQMIALSSAILILSSAAAMAEDFTVTQRNHEFQPAELSISVGDKVTFVNDDTGTHNVYSQSASNPFDLKAQRPGTSTNVVFSKAGSVDVRCAIHPSMRMQITVK